MNRHWLILICVLMALGTSCSDRRKPLRNNRAQREPRGTSRVTEEPRSATPVTAEDIQQRGLKAGVSAHVVRRENGTFVISVYGNSHLTNIAFLTGLPISYLNIGHTGVTDLSPLHGMPLRDFKCSGTLISDLSPLRGAPLSALSISDTPVSDLRPLKGLALKELYIQNTYVTDVNPLKAIPLETLFFSPEYVTNGIEVLRSIETLDAIVDSSQMSHRSIANSADRFWKRYDSGAISLKADLPNLPFVRFHSQLIWSNEILVSVQGPTRLCPGCRGYLPAGWNEWCFWCGPHHGTK